MNQQDMKQFQDLEGIQIPQLMESKQIQREY